MDKREKNFDDDVLIEMTDEDGNVFYYVEEMIIPVDGENFALLVEYKGEEHDCDCNHDHRRCHCKNYCQRGRRGRIYRADR